MATHKVDAELLEARYRPLLRLVRELIGVVPSCDPLLELWPRAFRSYNLLVPSFLHLPPLLFGPGSTKRLTGLAMYTSSRAAECAYCSAHCCSFALRRGASADSITGQRTPVEAAVVRLAEGLSRMPADLRPEDVASLRELLPAKRIERLVASIALTGFLNKFMDALGSELEPEALDDVADLLGPTGWSPGQHRWSAASRRNASAPPPTDSLATYLRVARQAPGAIRLERAWTRGVPSDPAGANRYLLSRTGITCPVLEDLPDRASVRALTTVFADNLDAGRGDIGLVAKGLAGLVFAASSDDPELAELAGRIVRSARVVNGTDAVEEIVSNDADEQIATVERLAIAAPADGPDWTSVPGASTDPVLLATLRLAHAVSGSPAHVSTALVTRTIAVLTPEQIIELICWISINQMMHRLIAYRGVADAAVPSEPERPAHRRLG